MSRQLRGSAALFGAFFAVLVVASMAQATTGEIRGVEADSSWSHATLAGSVYRTAGCLSFGELPGKPSPPLWPGDPQPEPKVAFSPCAWIPYATLGPSEIECGSSDRRGSVVGDGIQLVWWGGEQTGAGSAHFDLVDVALARGQRAPLLCLSVVEAAQEPIFCALVFPSPCPPYAIVGRHYQLDSATLKATALTEESPRDPGPPPPAEAERGAIPSDPAALGPIRGPVSHGKRCRKGKRKVGAGVGQTRQSRRCERRASGVHKSGSKN